MGLVGLVGAWFKGVADVLGGLGRHYAMDKETEVSESNGLLRSLFRFALRDQERNGFFPWEPDRKMGVRSEGLLEPPKGAMGYVWK